MNLYSNCVLVNCNIDKSCVETSIYRSPKHMWLLSIHSNNCCLSISPGEVTKNKENTDSNVNLKKVKNQTLD